MIQCAGVCDPAIKVCVVLFCGILISLITLCSVFGPEVNVFQIHVYVVVGIVKAVKLQGCSLQRCDIGVLKSKTHVPWILLWYIWHLNSAAY